MEGVAGAPTASLGGDGDGAVGLAGRAGKDDASSAGGASLPPWLLCNQAATQWLLVQEAARHCVVARMRTHLGGPAQSFAGIERMLQAVCARLTSSIAGAATPSTPASTPAESAGSYLTSRQHQGQGGAGPGLGNAVPRGRAAEAAVSAALAPSGTAADAAPSPSAPSSTPPSSPPLVQLQSSAWLLLELVGALERCLHFACDGGTHNPLPPALPRGVLAFFAANSRVCEEWLSGVRPLLLQAASLAGCHHHVAHYGLQRLVDLRARLKALLVARQQHQLQYQQLQAAAAAATAAAAAAGAGATKTPGGGRAQPSRPGAGRGPGGGSTAAAAAAAPSASPQHLLSGGAAAGGSPAVHALTPASGAAAAPTAALAAAAQALQATNVALMRLALETDATLKQVRMALCDSSEAWDHLQRS